MLIPPVNGHDHAQGPATAAITLVVYGDYQCPQCAITHSWIKGLQAEMKGRLRLVFRHFRTSRLYPQAAESAEAAGLQNRFWGMHDTLFKHQSALGNGHLVEYARDLGLDISQFLQDMAGPVPAEQVRLDQESGAQSGVQDTPTFFVNGVRHFTERKEDITLMLGIPATTMSKIGRWADDGASPPADGDDEESSELNHVP